MARTTVFFIATFAALVVVFGDVLTSFSGSSSEFVKYSIDTWGDYSAILLHAVGSDDKVTYILQVFEKNALLWEKEWTNLTKVSDNFVAIEESRQQVLFVGALDGDNVDFGDGNVSFTGPHITSYDLRTGDFNWQNNANNSAVGRNLYQIATSNGRIIVSIGYESFDGIVAFNATGSSIWDKSFNASSTGSFAILDTGDILFTQFDNATVGSPTSFSDHFYSGLLSLMDGQTGTIIDSVVFPVADNVLETVPQLVATPNGEFAAIVHLWKDFDWIQFDETKINDTKEDDCFVVFGAVEQDAIALEDAIFLGTSKYLPSVSSYQTKVTFMTPKANSTGAEFLFTTYVDKQFVASEAHATSIKAVESEIVSLGQISKGNSLVYCFPINGSASFRDLEISEDEGPYFGVACIRSPLMLLPHTSKLDHEKHLTFEALKDNCNPKPNQVCAQVDSISSDTYFNGRQYKYKGRYIAVELGDLSSESFVPGGVSKDGYLFDCDCTETIYLIA